MEDPRITLQREDDRKKAAFPAEVEEVSAEIDAAEASGTQNPKLIAVFRAALQELVDDDLGYRHAGYIRNHLHDRATQAQVL